MGAAGTALILFTPGDQTITALNWVWPPLTVVLSGWMFVQMRRSVTGKARWLLTPVIAVMALASLGATYDNVARTGDQPVAAPGKFALLPTLHRVGLGRLVPATSHLPAADAATLTAVTSAAQAYRNQRDEISVILEVFAQAQELTSLGDRPLAVLTASENNEGINGWIGAQDQLAGLSDNSVHRTVDSTHTGLLEDVRPAGDSVRAITEVVSAVRTGEPLPTR